LALFLRVVVRRTRKSRGRTIGESDDDDEILSTDLLRFLWGLVTNTTLDTALEAAESYFHLHPAAYKTDVNGYVICSPEKPKITFAADSN
jgi:hypothetical protein